MNTSFSGPSLWGVPVSFAGALLVVEVYSSLAKMCAEPINKVLVLKVLTLRVIADHALYALTSSLLSYAKNSEVNAKIYAATNLLVNLTTLVALRHLQVIANRGTTIFAALIAVEMICKYHDFFKYRKVGVFSAY